MDDKFAATRKELGGSWDITGVRRSGVEFLRQVLGGGNVVDKVTLATLITGPLTGEISITDGTNLHTLKGCYGRRNPTGSEPGYKFIHQFGIFPSYSHHRSNPLSTLPLGNSSACSA